MNQAILPRYVMRSAFFAMLLSVIGLWLLQMVFAYLSELENLSDTYTFIDALNLFFTAPLIFWCSLFQQALCLVW